MQKKKILSLLHMPPPMHGVTYMNSLIINNYKSDAHELELIELRFVNDIAKLGGYTFRKLFIYFRILVQFVIKLIKIRPVAVYCSITPLGKGFLRDSVFVFIARIFRKKVILHLHGIGIEKELTSKTKLFYYKLVFKNIYVITLSDSITSDIDCLRKSIHKIFVLNNGIPVQKEYPESVNRPDKFIITCLSTIEPLKGQLTLMKAIRILKERGYSNILCHIAGQVSDESYYNKLSEFRVENELIDMIFFDGAIWGEKKNMLLHNSDVFVFPTESDSFGLVILEAFNFRLPVIATNVGSIPEIIDDNQNGYVIERGDSEGIAEKLEYLILNESERKKMGLNGYSKLCNKYSLESFISNLNGVFTKILETD